MSLFVYIKMPHHGDCDDLSTLTEFIEVFNPEYAIISVGANNIYMHPSAFTEQLLSTKKIKEYRTDIDGEIIVSSDGNTISIEKSN